MFMTTGIPQQQQSRATGAPQEQVQEYIAPTYQPQEQQLPRQEPQRRQEPQKQESPRHEAPRQEQVRHSDRGEGVVVWLSNLFKQGSTGLIQYHQTRQAVGRVLITKLFNMNSTWTFKENEFMIQHSRLSTKKWEQKVRFCLVFNKTIIPLKIVRCEIIIVMWALRTSLTTYYLMTNSCLWNNS